MKAIKKCFFIPSYYKSHQNVLNFKYCISKNQSDVLSDTHMCYSAVQKSCFFVLVVGDSTQLWLHCWNKARTFLGFLGRRFLVGKPETLINWKIVILLSEIFHFTPNINSKVWNPTSWSIIKAQTTQEDRGWTAETSACLKSQARQGWLNIETIGGQTKGLGADQVEI